jgi:hypothetical protein
MRDSGAIRGSLGQCVRPSWGPLLGLVGEALMSELMWMSEIPLTDGTVLHAYKHILTRRYAHIAEDGRTFAVTPSGLYRPIDPFAALVEVFYGWERLAGKDDNVEVLWGALRQAYEKALEA